MQPLLPDFDDIGYLRNLLKYFSSVYNIGGKVKKSNCP